MWGALKAHVQHKLLEWAVNRIAWGTLLVSILDLISILSQDRVLGKRKEQVLNQRIILSYILKLLAKSILVNGINILI